MSADDKPPPPDMYSPTAWEEIVARTSFDGLPTDQVLLLYRHWLWADYSRQIYVDELEAWMDTTVTLGDLAFMGRDLWALFVWSGLLFVLVEGITQRRVRVGGQLAFDIRQIRESLNAARNATFHVGRPDKYWDDRLSRLWQDEMDADAAGRVHWALGRLLRTELSPRLVSPELRGFIGLDTLD